VKNAAVLTDAAQVVDATHGVDQPVAGSADHRTRDRVADLLLERGSATAAELSSALRLSPAAIRRHLDAMLAEGDVVAREQRTRGQRGRGRPAKVFLLTEQARGRRGAHTYDDLAVAALRWISAQGGDAAVSAFATDRVAALSARCASALADAGDDPLDRAEALAAALTAEGYAASATAIADGGQLCQHHCPVAHVAAEFPQLCEAETKVISTLVGTHVQRLATIAHGDGVCTTYIPAAVPGQGRQPGRPEPVTIQTRSISTDQHHRAERTTNS
jgi:predicted ArsR family transcriptional regulator